MEKNKNFILYLLLGLMLFFGYFLFLGSYPLLDVDETRYVDMAKNMFLNKDYLTLYLNGDFFFEKPPLFFWLECFSFKFFNSINEFCARIPIVLLSLLPLGLLFSLTKKIKGTKEAFIISSVLLSSLEYILITKIAILDSVLTSLVASSILCFFFTYFTQEKNKKYFWILTYVFCALAVLAKGLPGVIIPFLIIFISTITFKNYKETFKFLPLGIIIFLLITLPWHVAMFEKYPNLFYQEYIYKHHILRFLGSSVINRDEPWYFYIVTLFWGLVPHTFILILKLYNFIKSKLKLKKCRIILDKFLTLNIIATLSILIFFSLSATKLITYILPIYPFIAVIIGYIWIDTFKKYKKSFKKYAISICIYMLFIGIFTPFGYKLDYFFGQNDLMNYAKLAKENNYTISCYKTGAKYSLLYYSNLKHIEFKAEDDLTWLNQELNKENNIVITKNKYIEDLKVDIKTKGIKYSIIERGKNAKK